MHNIISTISVIYTLSAGALAIPTSIGGRAGNIGTRGQDADLKIYIWDHEDCTPTLEWTASFEMSRDSMQNFTTIPAAWFMISRSLSGTERLDWSSDVPGPGKVRAENVPHGCEYFEVSMNMGPPGLDLSPMPLQGKTCTSIGAMPISVSVPSA